MKHYLNACHYRSVLAQNLKKLLPKSDRAVQAITIGYRTETESNLQYLCEYQPCFQFSGLLNFIIKSRQQEKQKSNVAHVKRTQKYFGSPSQVKSYKLNLKRPSDLFNFNAGDQTFQSQLSNYNYQ